MEKTAWLKKFQPVINKWGLILLDSHRLASYESAYVSKAIFGHNYLAPHREDGPAIITYHLGGGVMSEEYRINGIPHREDGPARIYYYDNGKIEYECYFQNEILHRDNGPAEIWYDRIGRKLACEYYQNGRYHREDGPAVHSRDSDEYWVNGVYVDEQIVMEPHTQTLNQINKDWNIERKRIRIERYGWVKYLQEMKAVIIDEYENEIDGTKEILFKCKSGKKSFSILLCTCPSTARVYPIEVDGRTRKCKAAQKWLKGPVYQDIQIIGAS